MKSQELLDSRFARLEGVTPEADQGPQNNSSADATVTMNTQGADLVNSGDHVSEKDDGSVAPRTVKRRQIGKISFKKSQPSNLEHLENEDPAFMSVNQTTEVSDQTPAELGENPLPDPAQIPPTSTGRVRETNRLNTPVLSVTRARERGQIAADNSVVLSVTELTKNYGQLAAAKDVTFQVHAGSFTGVVGPNGAGKTTVLSMISGLNRPTSGKVAVNDIDVWADGRAAKRVIGSLPDRLRLFDRLTGAQLLYYFGILHGVPEQDVADRSAELAHAFGLGTALNRPVADYSVGMQKKIGLACALIHSPTILVLDEPFEAIDPVSASTVTDILEKFVAGGGSIIMSSHSLELIQRVCDHVVVITQGHVVAQGTVDSVRQGKTLEERFIDLTVNESSGKGFEWLRASGTSD